MVLALLAFLPRLAIPAGYMPGQSDAITLTLCLGGVDTAPAVTVDLGRHNQLPDSQRDKDHAPCAFAGASLPLLSGVPPLLAAAAIAYIGKHGLDATSALSIQRTARLRPPLRGPPTV